MVTMVISHVRKARRRTCRNRYPHTIGGFTDIVVTSVSCDSHEKQAQQLNSDNPEVKEKKKTFCISKSVFHQFIGGLG